MYRTILVPTDGSKAAERAAVHAIRIAAAYDASIDVLCVVDTPLLNWITVSEGYRDALAEDAARTTKRITGVAEEAGVTASPVVRGGSPAETIVEYAAEQSVDLVAMGTHGRTGLDRVLLGSVATAVVRRAAAPVLTVRREEAALSTESVADLGYERILVATDGSQGVEPAVENALDLADSFGATLHLLYVVDERAYATYPTPRGTWEEVRETLESRGKDAIRSVAERADDRGIPTVEEIREGVPHRSIVDYATAEDVDLVAMGTHGRGGIRRLVLGSVAATVVRTSPVPVLTAHVEQ